MPRTPKFKPNKPTKGRWKGKWVINIPPAYSEHGRRERQFFKTREEALEASAKLREDSKTFGSQSRAIAPTLAKEAHKAEQLLKPHGVGILEAVKAYIAQIEEAAASVEIEKALADFRKAKGKLSEKQQQAIRHMATHLAEDFAGRQLSTITTQELGDHIDANTGGDGAYNAKRRLIVTLWRWAAKSPRKWCRSETAEEVETRDTVSAEIGVLNAKEARKLLKAAEDHYPDCVPGFAIALFTGMRQAELARLRPSDLTDEGIQVPAASAKTRRRRFVNMPPALAAWLKEYPIGESVLPPNWKRKEIAVRRLAGWRVWSDLVETLDLKPKLKASPPAKLPEWPDNALRHTHATVALATGATLEELTFEFGHTGGPQMLRSHYVGAMPKKEALAILSIGPKGKKLKTIQAA
jgi:integrase